MVLAIVSVMGVMLAFEVLLLWKSQRDELRRCQENYLTCLTEAARAAEAIKNSCFAVLNELRNRQGARPMGKRRGAAARLVNNPDETSARRPRLPTSNGGSQPPLPSAGDANDWMPAQDGPEVAPPLRRTSKMKAARREGRKPIVPVIPINGRPYDAAAPRSSASVKL
jgi:hypothetical protein